jgi:hypothetical protein
MAWCLFLERGGKEGTGGGGERESESQRVVVCAMCACECVVTIQKICLITPN